MGLPLECWKTKNCQAVVKWIGISESEYMFDMQVGILLTSFHKVKPPEDKIKNSTTNSKLFLIMDHRNHINYRLWMDI